jgi:hypothetical protein
MATSDTPGELPQAAARKAAPRNLEVPTVHPSATGQTMTQVQPSAAEQLAAPPKPTLAVNSQGVLAPTQPTAAAPAAPAAPVVQPGIQPNPQVAANRQAEFAANRAGPVAPVEPVAAAPEAVPATAAGKLGTLGRAAKFIGNAVGKPLALGAAGVEGYNAVRDASAGDLRGGARQALLGGLDAAAAVPGPQTIPAVAGSLVAHGIDAGARAIGDDPIAGTINQAGINLEEGSKALSKSPLKFASPALMALSGLKTGSVSTDDSAKLKTGNFETAGNKPAAKALTGDEAAQAELAKTMGDINTPGRNDSPLRPDANPLTAQPREQARAGDAALKPATAEEALKSNLPGTAVINGRVLSEADIANAGKRVNVASAENMANPAIGTLGQSLTTAQGQKIADREAGVGNDVGFGDHALTHGIGSPTTVDQRSGGSLVSQIRDMASATGSGAGSKRRSARALIDLLGQLGNQHRTELEFSTPKPQSAAETALLGAQAQEQLQRGNFYAGGADKSGNIAQLQTALINSTDPAERKILESKLAAASGKVTPDTKEEALHEITLPGGSKIPVPRSALPDVGASKLLMQKLLESEFGTKQPAG